MMLRRGAPFIIISRNGKEMGHLKKYWKRRIVTDILGCLLPVVVHGAGVRFNESQ